MHRWTEGQAFHICKKLTHRLQCPAPPSTRGYAWQKLWWGGQLLAKCPGRPRAALAPRPEAGRADRKQHSTWDRDTHISLTLSQVTQSRTERNKNKELVSPQRRREQVPPPGPQRKGTASGGWAVDLALRKESRSARVYMCSAGCVRVCAPPGSPHPGCSGPSSAGGQPGLSQRPEVVRAGQLTKGRLPWPG